MSGRINAQDLGAARLEPEDGMIIAIAGGRRLRPTGPTLFAFGSLVNAIGEVTVVFDRSPLSQAVAEQLVRSTDAKLEEWLGNDILDAHGTDTDLLVLWPGAEGLRALAEQRGVLVLNADAIRTHVLKGNGPWQRHKVLERLKILKQRSESSHG